MNTDAAELSNETLSEEIERGIIYKYENPYKDLLPYIPPPPPTKEERKWGACRQEALNHISGKRTLRDEYHLILEKKSELPKSCRDWICSLFTE